MNSLRHIGGLLEELWWALEDILMESRRSLGGVMYDSSGRIPIGCLDMRCRVIVGVIEDS